MGRQQRTKQGDPAPLTGATDHPHSGAHVGKRKAAAVARSEGPTQKGGAKGGKGGRVKSGFSAGRGGPSAPANGGGERAAKRVKKSKKAAAAPAEEEYSEDDMEGLEEQDGFSDEEADEEEQHFANADAKGLEAARSALFNDEDLEEPTLADEFDLDREADSEDDEEEEDDEFDLEGDDAGVTLDDFEMTAEEAEMMPASGKKAAKRAARAQAYNSDDEDAPAAGAGKSARTPMERATLEDPEDEEDATKSDLEQDSEDELEEGKLVDLRAVERRMRNSARVLGNWKELGASSGKSRSDLIEQLIGDVCQYHGYTPYLAEKLFDLFGVDEALQFFTTSDTPRPLTLRVNTLKTRRRDLAQALINRGVNLEPLEGGWSKVGLQVFSGGGVPVGATPEYLAGHYILQSASSFLPVIALGPQPHERVLDMSAAPGGKTTYMSALMGNTGEVWANDSSRGRIKGLGGNVARLGCRNVVITNCDGREFPRIIGGFDRVLLDAPCSGTGVISKDQSVKINKTERDFTLLSHLQKQLVLCAIDSVTPNSEKGGYVVYSTCSVTTEENEAVVTYALRKRPHVKLVETGLAFGKEGFKSFRGKQFGKNMELTRRFYPHVHNMDGFYVAKFKVGKPAKPVPGASTSDDESAFPYTPLVDDEQAGSDASDAEEEPHFDDAEDEKFIEQAKRVQMKKKGLNPNASKSKAKEPVAAAEMEVDEEPVAASEKPVVAQKKGGKKARKSTYSRVHLSHTTSKLASSTSHPTPIALSRVHRLLRPLRSFLTALNSALSTAHLREAAEAATNRPSAPAPRRRGRERDGEWRAGGGPSDSSPFGGAAARKKGKKAAATYGTRKPKPVASTSSLLPSTSRNKTTTASSMTERGVRDPEVLARAQGVIRAWSNVLESVHDTRSSKGKGKAVARERDEVGVPTLVELCSTIVGWGIEEAVQGCMSGKTNETTSRRSSFGDSDQENDAEEDEDELGDLSVKTIRKGSLEDGQEDENLLADEWYEACPDYCSRWIFAQHSTAILLEGLQTSPFGIVEVLYDASAAFDRPAEAARFYDLLTDLGLSTSPSYTNSHALAVRAAAVGQSLAYFASLESTLLASSFAERLFYSDFLSLANARLIAGEEQLIAALCGVICRVGGEMLASIAVAAEGGERGELGLVKSVVARIEREVGFAIPFLLAEPSVRSHDKFQALEQLSFAIFQLLLRFPTSPARNDLAPISLLLELELLARDLDSASSPPSDTPRFERLSHLDSLSTSATPLGSHLGHLVCNRTSYTMSGLSACLSSLCLHTLDALLLDQVVEVYHNLPDVRATQGRGVLEKSAFFERLESAEAQSILLKPRPPTQKDEAGMKKEWRYEEMVSGYVLVTPALGKTLRAAASFESSPLGLSSLGQSDSAGRGRTPLKKPFVLQGRLRPRPVINSSPPPESPDLDLLLDNDDDDDDEEEEEYIDDEETPGPPTRPASPLLEVFDLSFSDTEAPTTPSETEYLALDSDRGSSAASEDLHFEILEKVPSPFPTSEVDDLDLLGGATRKRSASAVHPVRKQRLRMAVESDESDDELGM